MQQLLEIKVASKGLNTINILLGVIGGLPLGYVLVYMVHMMVGQKPLLAYLFVPSVVILCMVIVVGIILKYTARKSLTITRYGESDLSIKVEDKNEVDARGKWSYVAYHVRYYLRYGMYGKQLYLVTFCDGKAVCVFFHTLGGMQSAPDNFPEVPSASAVIPKVPVYITPKTYEIQKLLEANGAESGWN